MADGVLWPAALAVDRGRSIPDSHLDALSELGLFSMVVPAELGGLGLPPAAARAVLRILGAGCGATAFAFAQHHGVIAAVARTANAALRRTWLAPLMGRALGGTAFAHVRRSGPAAVRAVRTAAGWRIDGIAPWATSWGSAEVFSVAAVTGDDRLVWALVPGRSTEGLVATDPMSLLTFTATRTVRLRFDGLLVDDDRILEVVDLTRWRADDRRGAVRPNPLCIGVGDRALAELESVAPAEAAALGPWWDDVVERAATASVEVDHGSDDIGRIAAVRSETVFAVQRLTTALLAASGGRGANRDHPAQLLARQALFYVVQAQNADGRRATLGALMPGGEVG